MGYDEENNLDGQYSSDIKSFSSEIDSFCRKETNFDHFQFCVKLKQFLGAFIDEGKLVNVIKSLLELFIKANFIGPPSKVNLFDNLSEHKKDILSTFSPDDDVFLAVEYPEILFVVLECLDICLVNGLYVHHWRIRALHILQLILEDPKSWIYDKINNSVEEVSKNSPIYFESKAKETAFFIELSFIFLNLDDFGKSKSYIEKAKSMLGCSLMLTGAMGKRTQHQKAFIPQLVAVYSDCEQIEPPLQLCSVAEFPNNLKLQDDVCLETVEYFDSNITNKSPISPLKQSLILVNSIYTNKVSPIDELKCEEIVPFLNLILGDPTSWAIQFSSLYLRSLVEKRSSRRVDRSMRQLTELLEAIIRKNPSFASRSHHFYLSGIPPKWKIEQALAQILIKLGAVKSALEIFLKLEDWNNVFDCYCTLGRKNKAEEIARMLLEKENSVSHWCLLGDATDDPDCYLKAWDLSNQRSARAQKALGMLQFKNQSYNECKHHFRKSLELNSSQIRLWYYYGFCCLETEDYENAALAYRRCTCQDPDSFEAWNNLSKAYIKLGQKTRAIKTLEEALRCDYENWKIWENYILCCVDCGCFREVIIAYHRLLDLKPNYYDVDVLQILVNAIKANKVDSEGQSCQNLHKKACTLMGRISAQMPTKSLMWFLYGELIDGNPEKSDMNIEKQVQYYQKSLSMCVQENGWEKDVNKCFDVLERISIILSYVENCCDTQTMRPMLTAIGFSIKSLLSIIKKNHECYVSESLPEKLQQLFTDISVRAAEFQ